MKYSDLPRHWKIITAIISGIGILVGLIDSLATIKEKGSEALDILGSVTYFTGTVTLYIVILVMLFFLVYGLARWLKLSEDASHTWAWIITIGILIYYVPKDLLASLAFQSSSLSGSTSPLIVRSVGAIVLIVAGFALYIWLAPIISANIDGENKQTRTAQKSGATSSPAPPRATSATSVNSTTTVAVDKEADTVGDEITAKLLPLSKRAVKSRQTKQHIWLRWVVVICVGVGVYIVNNDIFVSTTTTVMFNKFCSALVERDYQTAYTQLSSDLRSRVKEEQFAKDSSGTETCMPGPPKWFNGNKWFYYGDLTATLTLSNFAGLHTYLVVLKNEKVLFTFSNWKIDGIIDPSDAAKTLDRFCNALNISPKNYQQAYAQFSESFQKDHSEQEFERGYAHYTTCKHDQPDVSRLDAATRMTLSDTAGLSKAIVVFILDNKDSWRIAGIQFS